jgi:hypothetical protein
VGAGHLPFEVSCDLLPRFIASATEHRNQLQTTQAEYRKPATTPVAMVRNYEGDSYGRNGYRWIEVEINGRVTGYEGKLLDGSHTKTEWVEYFYVANGTNGQKDVEHRLDSLYHVLGPSSMEDRSLAVATHLNGLYAKSLQREIDEMNRYIAWQQSRVENWKPAPLLPVTAKDKEGFKADE